MLNRHTNKKITRDYSPTCVKQKFRVSRGETTGKYRGNDVEALVDMSRQIGCRPIVKVKLGRSAVNCWMRARFRGWVGVMCYILSAMLSALAKLALRLCCQVWNTLFGTVVVVLWFKKKKKKEKRTNSSLSFSVAAEREKKKVGEEQWNAEYTRCKYTES